MDHVANVHALDLPGIAVGQPEVRVLHLPPVLDALLEDAVVVPDSVPPRYSLMTALSSTINVHRGERVHVARGQATQTAVAKSSVLIVVEHVFQLVAHLVERLLVLALQIDVDEDVMQQSAQQVLDGQVVHALRLGFSHVRLCVVQILDQAVAQTQ